MKEWWINGSLTLHFNIKSNEYESEEVFVCVEREREKKINTWTDNHLHIPEVTNLFSFISDSSFIGFVYSGAESS